MSDFCKLCNLRPGESAVVHTVSDPAHPLADRLRDLGLTAGSAVTCTMQSPLGDPCAYLVRGAVIALRRRDAGIVDISFARPEVRG